MYNFTKLNFSTNDLKEFESIYNKNVFTSTNWIKFIKEDQNANPLIVKIEKNNKCLGYFSALSFKKYGIKIIGSPFTGWSTCHMGIDLIEKQDKIDIYNAIIPYLFKTEKCKYIQINDRDISLETAHQSKIPFKIIRSLELKINITDNLLFKNMKSDCRNFIRQFERRGASVEIAKPNEVFAEEYYDQLKDVFAKQKLVPTYSIKKVKLLLKNMSISQNLLCLRVRNPDGNSIATSIFIGNRNKFYFWGGASYREYQSFRPNEYMLFTAIKYWRDKGCKVFDMVGVRNYKKKFGSEEIKYASLYYASNPIFVLLKDLAEKLFFLKIKLKGYIGK